MAKRSSGKWLDDLDGLFIGTLVSLSSVCVFILAFFFLKALLSSAYAVIICALAISAFVLLIALCIVSILLQK